MTQRCGYRVCHVDCGAEDYDTPAVAEPWLALFHAANAIHGSVDEQTYDENRRAEWDLPEEHEFSVTITASEARDLSQAMIGVAALKLAADAARASPQPPAAPAAAPLSEPMTERDHFDFALWQKRLLELADKYHEANPGPAGHRARVALASHAIDCATGWRARSYLAGIPPQRRQQDGGETEKV